MSVREVGRTVVLAAKVFHDYDKADTWLRTPRKDLRGLTPLEAAHTSEGAALVTRQLRSIESADKAGIGIEQSSH